MRKFAKKSVGNLFFSLLLTWFRNSLGPSESPRRMELTTGRYCHRTSLLLLQLGNLRLSTRVSAGIYALDPSESWTLGFEGTDSSMLDKSDESLRRVYNALANPIRRQIVQILKERGKSGFKELHDTLKISVGALYHHLDSLEGFVAQGPDRKYVLTEDGSTAVTAFSTGEEKRIANTALAPPRESRLTVLSKELLFGRALLNYLSQEPWRILPLAVTILAVGGAISLMTNLEPILLFYLNPTQGVAKAWFLLLFPLGWFITFGITDVMCSFFYHRKGGELSLVNGTAIALLPLLVVPSLILLIQPFSAVIRSASLFTILLQIAVQIWVVCLLSGSISVSKGLSLKRASLVSLAVMSLNVTGIILALSIGVF